jgi:hypothetical protein
MPQISKKHKNSKLILALLLALSLIVGACSSPTPSPTPTLEPTMAPEPTAVVQPVLESISQAELVGETWEWLGYRETMPASQSLIPDTQNYTLKFNEVHPINNS